jgi:hypothetical protein
LDVVDLSVIGGVLLTGCIVAVYDIRRYCKHDLSKLPRVAFLARYVDMMLILAPFIFIAITSFYLE